MQFFLSSPKMKLLDIAFFRQVLKATPWIVYLVAVNQVSITEYNLLSSVLSRFTVCASTVYCFCKTQSCYEDIFCRFYRQALLSITERMSASIAINKRITTSVAVTPLKPAWYSVLGFYENAQIIFRKKTKTFHGDLGYDNVGRLSFTFIPKLWSGWTVLFVLSWS